MNASKEEALKWISELKPGDKVIQLNGLNNPVGVLHIAKVTPSGIVRTKENLSFQQSKWTDCFHVRGIADARGEIVPNNETLAKTARENQERIAAEKAKAAKISKAKNLCYELAYGKKRMTLELAEAIIAACEKEVGYDG